MKTYDPKYQRFIFCLEGEWEDRNLGGQNSVLPMLQFIEQNFGIQYIHRKVGTKESLLYYLEKSQQYPDHGIIYMAFHGAEGAIYPSEGNPVYLIKHLASRQKGLLKNKLVHFSSCDTIKIPEKKLNLFIQATGAEAVSGFKGSVDWLDGTLLEIAFFSFCQRFKSFKRVKNELYKQYNELATGQKFELIQKPK